MFICFFTVRGMNVSIRAKRRIHSASRTWYAQTHHHHADHLRAWKDYLWIEKTIYGLKRLFTAQKKTIHGLRLFLQNSLFLITWHTFNQSMNKNIWMLYIIRTISVLTYIDFFGGLYIILQNSNFKVQWTMWKNLK